MAGTLIFLAMWLSIYTIFMPILTLDSKHLKIGLSLFVVLGVLAFFFYRAGMM